MFEDITYELILQRMLDRIPSDVDKREGSVIFDAVAPAAAELRQLYIELDELVNEAFADTASRPFLIRRAAERGITPSPATHAILRGEFTPTSIEMTGKRFSMANQNINYVVREKISPGVYQVECELVGVVGNQYLGVIIPIDYVNGLQTAELTDILIPAQDEQDTESLRQMYFETFNSKAYGGNIKDYLDKTNAIEGVGAVKVTPTWNGGGTVKLTILDAQYNPASTLLLDKVQQEIDPTRDGSGVGLAPIGHIVTVDTAAEVAVEIYTVLVFDTGYTVGNTQGRITDAIEGYLLELRKAWAEQDNLTVRITQIETRILAIEGVVDVAGTAINGTAGNLVLSKYQIPVFGGIIV